MNKKFFSVFILFLSLLGIGSDARSSVDSHYEAQPSPNAHQLEHKAKTGTVEKVRIRLFTSFFDSCHLITPIQKIYHFLLVEKQKTQNTALLENKRQLLIYGADQRELVFRFKNVVFQNASELHSS